MSSAVAAARKRRDVSGGLMAAARLDGEVVMITGGAGHVGVQAARVFLDQGARVVLIDRASEVRSARVRALRRNFSDRVSFQEADLSDLDSARQAAKRACKENGRLDVLVHCAAFVGTTEREGWAGPFPRQKADVWNDAFRVNVTSAFAMAQTCLPYLRRADPGRVILVGSIYGVGGPVPELYAGTGMSNPVGYGVSKGALVQLCRYLAVELGPKVRVNLLSPGGIERGQAKAFVRRYEQRTPLGRMAVESDLAGAFLYLGTRLSNYVTGHNLVVDGGWTAS